VEVPRRQRRQRRCSPESVPECRPARLDFGGVGDVCVIWLSTATECVVGIGVGDCRRRLMRRRRRDGIPLPPPPPVRSGVHVVRAARNAPPSPTLSTVAACLVCLQPSIPSVHPRHIHKHKRSGETRIKFEFWKRCRLSLLLSS